MVKSHLLDTFRARIGRRVEVEVLVSLSVQLGIQGVLNGYLFNNGTRYFTV